MLRSLRIRLGLIVGCVVASMPCAPDVSAQEPVPHLALVVGNAAYAAAPLPTTANDAGLVARALSQSGFAVTAAGDTDRARLDSVFEAFVAQVKAAGPEAIIFVYLVGYGVQFSGDIYFLPISANVARDGDVPSEAVSVSAFRRQLEALPAKARILVYDLARDDPVVQDGTRLAGGLPLIQPAAGTLVAFDAAPGTIAAPDVAPYGFYARALSEMIATPGLGLPALFERVRLRISMLTAGATLPWNSGTIPDDLLLTPSRATLRTAGSEGRPADASASDQAYVAAVARDTLEGYLAFLKSYPAEPLAARVRTFVAVRREALLWNETSRLDSDRAYWTYMRRYPRGPHLPDARRRLIALRAPLEPPPRFEIVTYTSAPLPPPAELPLVERPAATFDDAAWPPMPSVVDTLPSPSSAFYDELPPPPLAPNGILPIAGPISGVRPDGVPIAQPNVPSGTPIIAYTSFLSNGGWVVDSVAGGKTVGRLAMTPGPNADRTLVQTGSEGAVVARTTIVHDKVGTTIVQTGPAGGILTKSVTHADAGGGRTTVTTTGGNQMIATVQVDRQGMTSVTRGPAGLLTPRRPAASVQLAIPADPPAPPALTMPTSALPNPVVVAPAVGGKPADAKVSDPKSVDPKIADLKKLEATAPDIKPEDTAPDIVPPNPAAHLPTIAPLPPRRAVAAAKPEPARGAGPSKRAAPTLRTKGPARRRR